MVVWRRKSDGFEWQKHVRTTIKLKRADRRRRIEGARVAAVDGLKDAGRASAAAGRSGAALASGWASAAAAAVQAGCVRLVRAVPPAWAWARLRAIVTLRRACGPIRERGVQLLLVSAGSAAVLAAMVRLATAGASADAVLALLLGLAGLLAAALPLLLGEQALPRRGAGDVVARLAARLREIHVTARLPGRWSGRAAATAVAVLIIACASLGGAWLVWRGAAYLAAASGLSGLLSQSVEGRAAAVAGDVLRIGETEIRLAGIEAPEPGQRCARPGNRRWSCGAAARDALARIVRGSSVSCVLSGADGTGRQLGRCTARGRDVAEDLVREGHVFAETGLFSTYATQENEARAVSAGLWRGEAERPSEARAKASARRDRAWEEAKHTAPDGCPVKGQVVSGRKYYVLPGTTDYARIRIRARRGERWFCSEAEALAAGWLRSPRS